jgi:hypothetical protein
VSLLLAFGGVGKVGAPGSSGATGVIFTTAGLVGRAGAVGNCGASEKARLKGAITKSSTAKAVFMLLNLFDNLGFI